LTTKKKYQHKNAKDRMIGCLPEKGPVFGHDDLVIVSNCNTNPNNISTMYSPTPFTKAKNELDI